MNDKITIQELVEFISGNQSTSKKEIEAFAKEFFKLIEDALQTERYVKIKGFGTFKLIEVDSRESINVNTGERFEIQGHNKVTFTPDATLKEVVNKPFAHFESVVLNDGVFFEEEPILDEETPVTEEEPIIEEEAPIIEEPIIEEEPSPIPLLQEEEVPSTDVVGSDTEEENPIIEEEEPIIEEEVPVIEEPIIEEEPSRDAIHCVREEETPIIEEEEPTIEETAPIIEEPIVEDEPLSRDVACSVREEETPIIEEEEPIIEEEVPVIEEETPITEEETPKPTGFIAESITNIENDLETNKRPESMIGNIKNTIVNDFKQDTQGMKYFFGIVIFIILLCIAAIVFLYHPTLLTDLMPQPKAEEETTTEEVIQEAPTAMPADTVAIFTDSIATSTVVDSIAPVAEVEVPAAKETVQEAPVVKEPIQEKPVAKETPAAQTYSAKESYHIVGTQSEHTIKRGETLRIISEKYFGTRELATYIIEHNKENIPNPNNVSVGTKIKIPKLEKK
jgi:nucleoid DNA-binding protein